MEFSGPSSPPVIVKKVKRGGHGGHHGGSWKVAYADFVTAMMALFIVLWVLSQGEQVKKAVAAYFTDPSLTPEEIAIKLKMDTSPSEDSQVKPEVEPERHTPEPEKDMNELANRLKSALESADWVEDMKGQIIIEVTDEGLRIELLDLKKNPFFDVGSPVPRPQTRKALAVIARQLARNSNPLILEGHTDSRPFKTGKAYGNWELSVERANAARRILEYNGIDPARIVEVRGFADKRLRDPENPYADVNRRISIVVLYDKPKDNDAVR